MRTLIIIILFTTAVYSQVKFDDYFYPKQMRFDYFHSGNNQNEYFSFDEIIEEPYWGGSKVNLIDDLGYGYFMFKIFDDSTGTLIYSRGYSTLFQEWQTTGEAKITMRTMSESVIFPFPKKKVRLEILRRNKKNEFKVKFSYAIDPANYFIKHENKYKFDKFKVHNSGDPSEKLDIVFIPDGYTDEEMEKFKDDCDKFSEILFSYEPFGNLADEINIWGIDAPSGESGTDIPGEGTWKNTIINTTFYTFDSERYLMTSDYKMVRNIAANAPYDQIYIIVNTDKYGGGAIYNYYSCTAAHNSKSKKIFIHEFGHGLAGLADEYYTSDVSYQDYYPLDVEPWEANITTLVNFESKWKDLIAPETPVPTPDEDRYKNVLGVFEGGGYVAKGVYRPTYNSLMKAFDVNEFNVVCKLAIEKVVKYYAE